MCLLHFLWSGLEINILEQDKIRQMMQLILMGTAEVRKFLKKVDLHWNTVQFFHPFKTNKIVSVCMKVKDSLGWII